MHSNFLESLEIIKTFVYDTKYFCGGIESIDDDDGIALLLLLIRVKHATLSFFSLRRYNSFKINIYHETNCLFIFGCLLWFGWCDGSSIECMKQVSTFCRFLWLHRWITTHLWRPMKVHEKQRAKMICPYDIFTTDWPLAQCILIEFTEIRRWK